MKNTKASKREHYAGELYEIRLQGYLQEGDEVWFDGLTITRENDGTTMLLGMIPDQTALHGILLRIKNLNLELITIEKVE